MFGGIAIANHADVMSKSNQLNARFNGPKVLQSLGESVASLGTDFTPVIGDDLSPIN